MINKLNSFQLNCNFKTPDSRNYIFAFVALFTCLLIIYGNSFNCEWLFDDYPNIVQNKNIHLQTLSWSDISNIFKQTPTQGLPRYVAYLSFALNYYSGGLNVFGYHAVNFAIHFITTIFLFLFIYKTFSLPLLKKYSNIAYPVALLSAFLWATNPVQVNAVTYIVQRMTCLTGMFYIMSMYFYLNGRTSLHLRFRILNFSLFVLCALLAFFTKENAAMLPASVLIYDLLLIQGISKKTFRNNLFLLVLSCLILVGLGFVYLKFSNMIFINFKQWTFTLEERLLTEPRVIFLYISLLLYPISSRLMVEHDIDLSRSLIDPWTTLVAIAAMFVLIGYALYQSRKRPLLSFCILFFFLNHLIEGSFIALDLIFEHRNYIPSMFFFVPIAILIIHILDYFAYRKSIQLIMTFGMVFLFAAQAHTVYIRNEIMLYQKILWEDNVQKAPNLSRPLAALGKVFFDEGDYEKGAMNTSRALQLSRFPNYYQPALYHCSLGNYYLTIKQDDDKAEFHYRQALQLQPNIPLAYKGLALLMLKKGLLKQAHNFIEKALKYKPGDPTFQHNFARILLKEGVYSEAIRKIETAKKMQGGYDNASLAVLAEAYYRLGHLNRAIFYWENYLLNEPTNFEGRLALIELYSLINKHDSLIQSIGIILTLKGKDDIFQAIKEAERKKDAVYVPEGKVIIPIITKELNALFPALKHK